MLRAAARRAYWGTQAWQDQALAAKRAASSTQMVSLATLQSLYSFRPGIAYVLDALYLAPTARSPARRTMRSCRGAAFATKDAGLAPLPASRAATTTPSGTRVTRTARDSGFEPLPDGAEEPSRSASVNLRDDVRSRRRRHPRRSATELSDLVRDWVDKTGAQSVVIQGEGDPLAAEDVVCETLRLAKGSGAQFRLNTLGVGATDAIFDALGLVETVSVFLPAADATSAKQKAETPCP